MQPIDFQEEVLRSSVLRYFAPGDVVYRFGDDLGGIYGLVSGVISITTAPPMATPQLVHIANPGWWTGEGCFLTRQPRKLGLRALVDTWMLNMPLDAMDKMMERQPTDYIHFSQILMINTDILIRIVNDLQKPEAEKRIAAVLQRMSWSGKQTLPITQNELGGMANASRKQVNAALKMFAAQGWISKDYRSVAVLDGECLHRFSEGETSLSLSD